MKNRFIAAFFAFFFGGIALNEFYLGNKHIAWVEVLVSLLLWWIGGSVVISLINIIRGCQYLFCVTDAEMIQKYGNSSIQING